MHSSTTINLPSLLEFFDEGIPSSRGHATAVNAVLGEEIAIGLMAHYFSSMGCKVEVKTPCTQGTQRGVRLDCWILTDDLLYQVEIKNWSSHSFGGRVFPTEEIAVERHLIDRWENQWIKEERIPRDKAARKVLVPMKPPEGCNLPDKHEAMLCFWDPMHPAGKSEPLFTVPTADDCFFDELFVFSLSNYVKNLIKQEIYELEILMPNTMTRLAWLKKMCSQ
jgi:hypothetical protein